MSGDRDARIRRFLEYDPTEMWKKSEVLWSIQFVVNLTAMPTAFCGVYAEVTRWLLPPLSGLLLIWLIYLCCGFRQKRIGITLHFACLNWYCSLAATLAVYKLQATIAPLTLGTGVGFLLGYLAIVALAIVVLPRVVLRSYAVDPPKSAASPLGIGVAAFALASFGITLMRGHLSQHGAVVVLQCCLELFALLGIMNGSIYGFKYTLMKRQAPWPSQADGEETVLI